MNKETRRVFEGEFLSGQVVDKAWMVLLSIPFDYYLRRRDRRIGLTSV